MQATLKTVQAATENIKMISDQTQAVVQDVRNFVDSIKQKCDSLEQMVEGDVKGTINQIRAILDTVPKMPELPSTSGMGMGMGTDAVGGGFNITDYIPGMASTKTPAAVPPVVAPPAAPAAAPPAAPPAAPVAAPIAPMNYNNPSSTPLQSAISSQAMYR
jgi:hypothetical protein